MAFPLFAPRRPGTSGRPLAPPETPSPGDPLTEARRRLEGGAPPERPIAAGLRPQHSVSGAAPLERPAPSVLGSGAGAYARGREVAALVLWTGAVFLILALATYMGDPNSSEASASTGENWVGPVGETVARAFVTLLGVTAWAIPIEALLLGIPYVRGRKSEASPARLAGDLLIVLVVASLVCVGAPTSTAFGKHPAAGAVGELFGELARSLFSSIGSFLVGTSIVGLVLIARASFSFIALVSLVARVSRYVFGWTKGAIVSLLAAWREARALEREEAERARLEALPNIASPRDDQATIAALPLDDGPEPPVHDEASAAPRPAESALRVRVRELAEPEPDYAQDSSDGVRAALAAELGDGGSIRKRVSRKRASPAGSEAVSADGPLAVPSPFAPGTALPLTLADKAPRPRGKRLKKEPAPQGDPDEDDVNDLPADFGGDDEDDPSSTLEEGLPASRASKAPSLKAPAMPTIVDTSAALLLERDLPADHGAEGDGSPLPPHSGDERLVVSSGHEPSPTPLSPAPVAIAAMAMLEPKAMPSEPRREVAKKKAPVFQLPPIEFLVPANVEAKPLVDSELLFKNAELLVKTLADYRVSGKVEDILPGPTVTTYEVSPVAGTKVSKVAALADDLALALAKKVRIVAPIPGKNRIGFEIPNEKRIPVNLRDLTEDRRFQAMTDPLPVVLGRDIVGAPIYADLASMPHVIVAGATGAGKSVGLNVMLTSLLYRRTPDELRLLMIDPKVVELAPFDRIPHMLLPVVTDMKQAATALKWAVDEMERRYQLFADAGTKNIGTYNNWVERVKRGEAKNPCPKTVLAKDFNGFTDEIVARENDVSAVQQFPEKMPYIVIVVDEFADLMMQQGKEVEAAVARLAQKARAAGMHVILATQRPSVDVITGMIKANFPTRIAFRVAQKVDSRTILDEQGAEHLLGRGDMLVKLNGSNDTKRVQCPWVSEEEVQKVTDFLRSQGEPVYDENILKPRDDDEAGEADADVEEDAMYDAAVRLVTDTRRCSTSWIQRKLGLGYNRAARIVEMMEKRGLVGPANGAKDREVLVGAI